MEAAGQRRVVRAEDVAVMGITEILRHIPRILAAYRTLVHALHRERPALAILIDFPDVNFRLARHCKRLNIPVLWLVSPQLWAWKRRRLRWVQQRVSKMLVIFPFEADFYRVRNVNAEFIGHPLASLPLPTISREEYARRATEISQEQWRYCGPIDKDSQAPDVQFSIDNGVRYELDPRRTWIALLPGSRRSEFQSNLRAMVEAAEILGDEYECIVPLPDSIIDRGLKGLMYDTGDLYMTPPRPPRITFVRDARAALHHSRAAIIASGTATVQALILGIPFVVVYKVSRLTYALAKRLIRYPSEVWPPENPLTTDNRQPTTPALPIAMPNLIAGRRIVPELLNDNFTAPNVAAALKPLLTDTPERTRMLADLAETRTRLLAPGNKTPIERAADDAEILLYPA